MNDEKIDGHHVVVEIAHDGRRGKGPSEDDACYNCGKKGHWANECREGDWMYTFYIVGDATNVGKKATSKGIAPVSDLP